MRNSIDTYVSNVIEDNKEYILEDAAAVPTRTIAEWMWLSIESQDDCRDFFDYEEYKDNENDEPSAEQKQELHDYLYSYYDVPSTNFFEKL